MVQTELRKNLDKGRKNRRYSQDIKNSKDNVYTMLQQAHNK